MTKKDYELIARVIRQTRVHGLDPDMPSRERLAAVAGMHTLTARLTLALAADSPRFDKTKFLEASEYFTA